ncbi:MAG: M10 family metallopeptidase C-terminal domain-containing protein [Asticcacaulis sp.]
MTGSGDADVLFGGRLSDQMFGNDGNDRLDGGRGNDVINGGDGNDILTGEGGNDTFAFTSRQFGNDTITDFVIGQDKIDLSVFGIGDFATLKPFLSDDHGKRRHQLRLWSIRQRQYRNHHPDRRSGGNLTSGSFILRRHPRRASQTGSGDADVLFGGQLSDQLFGNDGNDLMSAGLGNDILNGGDGSDRLIGGGGNDIFAFTSRQFGNDTISDFVAGQDRIDLSALNIGDFTTLLPFMSETNGTTTISFGYGQYGNANTETITLTGVTKASLDASSFIFSPSATPLVVSGSGDADVLFGAKNSDQLFGNGGNDVLSAGPRQRCPQWRRRQRQDVRRRRQRHLRLHHAPVR